MIALLGIEQAAIKFQPDRVEPGAFWFNLVIPASHRRPANKKE